MLWNSYASIQGRLLFSHKGLLPSLWGLIFSPKSLRIYINQFLKYPTPTLCLFAPLRENPFSFPQRHSQLFQLLTPEF